MQCFRRPVRYSDAENKIHDIRYNLHVHSFVIEKLQKILTGFFVVKLINESLEVVGFQFVEEGF